MKFISLKHLKLFLALNLVSALKLLLALKKYAGPPVEIRGQAHSEGPKKLIADKSSGLRNEYLATAQIKFGDGCVAHLVASHLIPDGCGGLQGDGWDRMQLFGNDWGAAIQPNPRPFSVWDNEGSGYRWPMHLEIMQDHATGMLAEELRCFVGFCRGDPLPTGVAYEDGLTILDWISQLKASSSAAAAAASGGSC